MGIRQLNTKQETFVREYLVDLNATQAAIRSGYSKKTASQIAERTLKKPHVAAVVQAAMDERASRTNITADRVLKEIGRIALFDPRRMFKTDEHGRVRMMQLHEMPDDVVACISQIEINCQNAGVDGDMNLIPIETVKVKFWDKKGSLELAGRHLKLFTDKVEHSGEVSELSYVERLRRAKEKRAHGGARKARR